MNRMVNEIPSGLDPGCICLYITPEAHDYAKFNLNCLWYSLWMSFKGPHKIMVTAPIELTWCFVEAESTGSRSWY